MSFSRQILNLSIRIITRHLQCKINNVQNVYNQIFHVQHYNFSLSKRMLERNNQVQESEQNNGEKQALTKIKPKLHIVFVCKKCNTQNKKTMSKHAYEKGVVIIRCDGCRNNHLIADNLRWFTDSGSRNIEQILKTRGENVRRIRNDKDGYFEAYNDEPVHQYKTDDNLIKEGKDYVNSENKKVEGSKNDI